MKTNRLKHYFKRQTLVFKPILFLIAFILFQFPPILLGQIEELNDDGSEHTHFHIGNIPLDFYIPLNPSYNSITFEIRGGDGGSAQAGNDCKSWGGDGATTLVSVLIGSEPGHLQPGSYVRFIVADAGSSGSIFGSNYLGSGGGGGSAILISENQVDWEILAVAGGGSGAYQGNILGSCVDSQSGQGGRSTTHGGDGGGNLSGNGGSNGSGGTGGGSIGDGDLAGGGGGAFSNGSGTNNLEGKAGFPSGGSGGTSTGGVGGGWGFGGGGAGEETGGGGGGYSGGGGGGLADNGGGGGSYVNPGYTINTTITEGGRTSPTTNGEIAYQFTNIDFCTADITGFTYENPLCASDDQGRIKLNYTTSGGNVCDSELEFSLEPINGWHYLGGGVFRSMRAGTYTASVKNTTLGFVIEAYTFTVGVTDEAPTAVCKDITVDLTDGTYSNNNLASLIDGGSFGPCDPVLTASKTSFDCSNLGDNTVNLIVRGSHNLASTCQANVFVQNSPSDEAIALCKENLSFDLGGRAITLTADDIDNGSTVGGCAVGMSISPSTFDCSNLGPNSVTLTVGSGQNIATCTTTITITNNNTPTANCKSTASVTLVDGSASIDYTLLENGSLSNNCSDLTYEINQSAFDCTHLGPNDISLTVTDGYNNESTCVTTVSVLDNTNPIAICKNIEIALDENGSYTLDPAELDGGSSDECGFALSASKTLFDCGDLGEHDVILTATDPQGNKGDCVSEVTLIDDLAPQGGCFDITIKLSGGVANYAFYKTQLFQSASDNCNIASLNFINSTTLSCEDLGTVEHGVEVIDNSGNRAVCTFEITVVDEDRPRAYCQDLTVSLDETGNATITPEDIDNGSYDDCTDIDLALNQSQFDCNDIGSNNIVTLTVTDDFGNTNSCDATITVNTNGLPIPGPCQNQAATLNGSVDVENCEGKELTMKFHQAGTSILMGEVVTTLDAIGNFTVASMGAGTYDIRLKMENSLQKMQTETFIVGDNNIDFGEMKMGDVNNDNLINFADFGLLSSSFNKSASDDGFMPLADLNCDGVVNFADFGLFSGNFNQVGQSRMGRNENMPEGGDENIGSQQLSEEVLWNVYPTRFVDQTTIEFELKNTASVEIQVFNLMGMQIQQLEMKQLDPGPHRYIWNGKTGAGQTVSEGVYMIHLLIDKKLQVKKVMKEK